ncbi:MAG: PASTA domain-containing protein [Candidatus Cloacimonadales bacterium]
MKHLKALGVAIIFFVIFVSAILLVTTKIVIPLKLDIGKTITMPTVVGIDLEVAKSKLQEAGFTLQDSLSITWVSSPNYADNTVISQIPRGEKVVKKGSGIRLEVSSGGKIVVVPSVLEENAINASSKLKQLGLEVVFIKKNYGLYAQNSVVKVDPGIGSKVLKGSKVILYIESEVENEVFEVETSDELDSEEDESFPEPNIEDRNLEEILEDL